MSDIDGEVRVQFVNIDMQNGETQLLTLSSYDDDTVIYIGEAGDDPKLFSMSKEQLQELYNACGKALESRQEMFDDKQAHFTNEEVREYLESE